jgi:hypothetical protein
MVGAEPPDDPSDESPKSNDCVESSSDCVAVSEVCAEVLGADAACDARAARNVPPKSTADPTAAHVRTVFSRRRVASIRDSLIRAGNRTRLRQG